MNCVYVYAGKSLCRNKVAADEAGIAKIARLAVVFHGCALSKI